MESRKPDPCEYQFQVKRFGEILNMKGSPLGEWYMGIKLMRGDELLIGNWGKQMG